MVVPFTQIPLAAYLARYPPKSLNELPTNHSNSGVIVAAAGQAVRLLALFTAQHNFTHDIAEEKKEEHYLVTNGIYQCV